MLGMFEGRDCSELVPLYGAAEDVARGMVQGLFFALALLTAFWLTGALRKKQKWRWKRFCLIWLAWIVLLICYILWDLFSGMAGCSHYG